MKALWFPVAVVLLCTAPVVGLGIGFGIGYGFGYDAGNKSDDLVASALTATAPSSATVASRSGSDCYDVKSSLDRISFSDLNPPSGETLRAGESVTITLRATYHLDSQANARINFYQSVDSQSGVTTRHITQSDPIIQKGDGNRTLSVVLAVPAGDMIQLDGHLDPTHEAMEAGGYSCYQPIASMTVATYRISRAP